MESNLLKEINVYQNECQDKNLSLEKTLQQLILKKQSQYDNCLLRDQQCRILTITGPPGACIIRNSPCYYLNGRCWSKYGRDLDFMKSCLKKINE
jgi:hypothetical protein